MLIYRLHLSQFHRKTGLKHKHFMTNQIPENKPHRRFNPLNGDWILVSPHRATRPWQGQVEESISHDLAPHDPDCYLCAGNTRASSKVNPEYSGPYVFDNDFPALLDESVDEHSGPEEQMNNDGNLFHSEAVSGVSKVICFSEQHHLTLPEMTFSMVRDIVDTWAALYLELGQRYPWVQIFENKGAINGCSNPHPHGQLWASDQIPTLVMREDEKQKNYLADHGENLLVEYGRRELALGKRIVAQNEHWLVLVPYWATWPYETLLLPKRQVGAFVDLENVERDSLAKILQALTIKYDNLFKTSFPYSMGWHCAPTIAGQRNEHWQLHAHFYPPLLRSASIKKFMVGYEMLAEAQRDMTPEQAAEQLAQQSDIHFKARL
ncbi:MAG: UDPglucose--hexose-1-phosphate uridylyltransferase [Candidatus Azotimanducaceae bacterium]|jgi:UDPglucose--hexose-1-phosphate uridylyltransferase